MKLYHYSKKKLSELLTRELQGVVTEEERKDPDMVRIPGPYYDHVSLFFDPIPSEILGDIFPSNHHAWATGNELVEHVVDANKLLPYAWSIVESPLKTFFFDHIPWLDNETYQEVWLKTRLILSRMKGDEGEDLPKLLKAIKRYQNTTRDAYLKLSRRADKDSHTSRYASLVPHLMVYTHHAIPVDKVNRIVIGSSKRTALELGVFANWK